MWLLNSLIGFLNPPSSLISTVINTWSPYLRNRQCSCVSYDVAMRWHCLKHYSPNVSKILLGGYVPLFIEHIGDLNALPCSFRAIRLTCG